MSILGHSALPNSILARFIWLSENHKRDPLVNVPNLSPIKNAEARYSIGKLVAVHGLSKSFVDSDGLFGKQHFPALFVLQADATSQKKCFPAVLLSPAVARSHTTYNVTSHILFPPCANIWLYVKILQWLSMS